MIMKTMRVYSRVSILAVSLFCVSSCKDKQETVTPTTNTDSGTSSLAVEEAYPDTRSVWQNGTLFGNSIRYGVVNNEAIYEGDIILTPGQLASTSSGRVSGAGTQDKILRWKGFTVPYTIDPGLPNQNRVTDAIAHWEARTPLRFVVRTTEPDYITFKKGSGCDSNIGRIGGQQFIRLASGCTTGSTIHEIGHAVGLLHEQTRSDRDNFVTIHEDNIDPVHKDQFTKYTDDDDINGFKFGDYDFNSIMHYPWNAFAIDKTKPTISRKDGGGNLTFGQRNDLSSTDRRTVIAMYSNLYIVEDGDLWAVCVKDGSYAKVSDGWDGFTAETMAEDDKYLWAIHGETLYRVNRLNGSYDAFGNDWNGALGVTSIVNPSTLWAIKGNNLYAINKDGVRKDVDNFLWGGSKAIFAHRDFLFIVGNDGTLWKNDMNTAQWHNLGNGWENTSFIAAAFTTSQDIYIAEGNSLWRVNGNTGSYTLIGPSHWNAVKGMVGIAGKLYIVDGSTLYEVDENGNRRSLGGGWGGTKSMGIIRNGNIL